MSAEMMQFQPSATAPFGRVLALQWAGQGLFYGIRSKRMSSKKAVRFLVTDEKGNRICVEADEGVYRAATDWMPLPTDPIQVSESN